MRILGLTIALIASRAISSGCFLFLLLPGFVGSLSPGCPVLPCAVLSVFCNKRDICVRFSPQPGLLKVLLEHRSYFNIESFSFINAHKCTQEQS